VAVLMVSAIAMDRLHLLTQEGSEQRWSAALECLPQLIRKADFFCRVGERQLCLVLPGLGSAAQALLAAHKFSRAVSGALARSGEADLFRVLVGIACFPEHADSAERLLRTADAAIGRAEASEDGICPLSGPGTVDVVDELPVLRQQVLEVLRSNDFRLAYQPQLNLATGRCEGVEALLRCTLPDGSALAPGILVAAAEREGKLGSLTNFVLNASLRQAASWRKAGVETSVSVNLAPDSLRDPDLPAIVARSLDSWAATPGALTLEIVESSMVHNFAEAAAVLRRLKELGVKLSVDDFGTGYSCLAYLRQLPLDELKIDRAFVSNIARSKGDRQLVQAMIDLAHSFGLHAVAEGVEDDGTLETLRDMGCDLVQGYVYSRPLEANDFLAWRQR
jgi:EAL domain-containing protein (putative c-di-GMP-specific phosphodiesterase class I)